MPLVNTKIMLEKALKSKYAVPAFNINNMETLKAVVKASEELKRDTIISASEGALEYAGADMLYSMVKCLADKSKINFALHLDHGKSFEVCKKAIDAGFTSVMFDGSSLPYDENVKETKKVVKYAHSKGVTVEAELGKILGVEDMVSSETEHFTDPLEALDFVTKTGVDSLAISIGTAHGINKGTKKPEIRFDIIDNVHKAIPSIPLVAHGSSSVPAELVKIINSNGGDIKKSQGIPEETISKMAKSAICKINIDTDLRLAFTAGVRTTLSSKPDVFDPRKYLGQGMTEITAQAKHIFNLVK
ncbi:MAG: ketose-bisphosphate aldolase [Clostridia bacterium]|nr:ketose-bisphosphate aldolase [Clostridia bacterium]